MHLNILFFINMHGLSIFGVAIAFNFFVVRTGNEVAEAFVLS